MKNIQVYKSPKNHMVGISVAVVSSGAVLNSATLKRVSSIHLIQPHLDT